MAGHASPIESPDLSLIMKFNDARDPGISGMDVKAAVDGGLTVFSDLTKLMPSINGALWFAAACIVGVYFFARSNVGLRARAGLEEAMFSNWRLALLGTTGVVLSLASGYTTWDGMRNFTGEAVLSGMVTFGIQGVMLIVAWLIGESFAVGMNQIAPDGTARTGRANTAGMVIGVSLVGLTFYAFQRAYGGVSASGSVIDVSKFSSMAIYFAFALLLLALVVLHKKSDLAQPYVQSTRVVVRSAVLWVMFLACMATSVFFSFDSLFSAIFPQAERQRAAEIRSVNQVAAVVSDIGELTDKRRIEQAQSLFTLPAWAAYEAELDKAMRLASEAPDKIREQMTRELEAQKSRIAKLEEQKASAQSGQAGLVSRKQLLVDNLSRFEVERPEAAQKFAEQKAVVSEAEMRLDEARTKILAEEKGVEGSGKAGRGQFYRAAKGDEERVQSEIQVARERLKGHEARLNGIVRGISTAKAELARIDGSLANLKGEADTAVQMIAMAQNGGKTEVAERLDPVALAGALERDRQTFRQKPELKTLAALQNDCLMLQSVSLKVASLHDAAASIDCDPKQASEAAGRVFALNAGVENFAAACAGGDKLAGKKTTDDLLGFGRKCLQDSGLPSKDTAEIAGKLSAIDLSRDDKAHRFVVTLNAFQDGNRLAYLALALAIAIDSLVFMSGLFGANAVRSPLSGIPNSMSRSSGELEAIIEEALLPKVYENARAVQHVMHAIAPFDGFTAEVIVPREGFSNPRITNVLAAGATIGAVIRDSHQPNRYLVRGELLRFLSLTTKKAFEADEYGAHVSDRRSEYESKLKRTVEVALMPNPLINAQIMQDAMHPMDEVEGFSAEVRLEEMGNSEQTQLVRKVLNIGASFRVVKRMIGHSTRFMIHRDLVHTLSDIQARLMMAGAYPQTAITRETQTRQLHEQQPQVAVSGLQARIAAAKPRVPTDDEIRQGFIDQLVQAIGVQPEIYARATGPAIGAAISAGEAFNHVRDRNAALQHHLAERDERAEKAFFEVYSTIQSQIADNDERRIDLLNDAFEDLRNKWAIIMLMPDGPYENLFEDLIAKLEPANGAGRLSADDRNLLFQLKGLKANLAASDRNSAEDWQRLQTTLQPGGADVLMFEQAPKSRFQGV